ncbi:hypothetical protein M0R72_00685 [Candidatus Pacearchaeota archaeon]|nr:hypothetical protein [Candidatus Pacearchaeota archaeon]
MAVGIGVFAGAVTIATPSPVLRLTEDSKLSAEYDAPIASFLGSVPNSKGMAHPVRTAKRVDSASVSAQSSDEPTFGQFSTREAMNYQTVSHHSRTPTVRQAVPVKRVVPIVHVIIGEITYGAGL